MDGAANLRFAADFQQDPEDRLAFNRLSGAVFPGLDFEPWYQMGGWDQSARPFALFDGREAAACLLAIEQPFWLEGRRRRTVQLGSVAVAPAWRGRGLARRLMEQALEQCPAEMVFLYANCQAAGFYRHMGFRQAHYYRYSLRGEELEGLTSCEPPLKRLDPMAPGDRARLLELYRLGDMLAEPGLRGAGEGVFLFHCIRGWRHIYELPGWDTLLLFRREWPDVLCGGIWGGQGRGLRELLSAAVGGDCRRMRLGFTPAETAGMDCSLLEEPDTLLFVKGENLFENRRIEIPLTART